jgi:hypothetical protein
VRVLARQEECLSFSLLLSKRKVLLAALDGYLHDTVAGGQGKQNHPLMPPTPRYLVTLSACTGNP